MWTEDRLNELLTTPSAKLVEDMKRIEGDIIILGAGGKMGPTLSLLAQKAIAAAGGKNRVIAVSKFTDSAAAQLLTRSGIEVISADLLSPDAVHALPDAANVIYMAGRKFGTDGEEYLTWAMNTWIPTLVAEKYKNSRIAVFSSGNIYPLVQIHSGGATEDTPPHPNGEYGMSTLGRERIFEYASRQYGTKVLQYRLNYAVDLRYGVLYDIAKNIMEDRPVSLATPCFNCIWQGDANEIALRSLLLADSPPVKLNVTGPETVSVRYAAEEQAKHLGKPVRFEGEPQEEAYLSNSAKCVAVFGYPSISVKTLIKWQAQWILSGGRTLDKPTHFEQRKGKY